MRIRNAPIETFRHPLMGENVEVRGRRAHVTSTQGWDLLSPEERERRRVMLKGQLGEHFRAKYLRVTVRFEGSQEVAAFDVWEVVYDLDRDPDQAPWRG